LPMQLRATMTAQFFRGVFLTAYILLLGTAALYALRDGVSHLLLDPPAATPDVRTKLSSATVCETPAEVFKRWVTLTRHTPVSGQTIDPIWPGWRSITVKESCDAVSWQTWWVSEFEAIDDMLMALVGDDAFDPKTMSITDDILPPDF